MREGTLMAQPFDTGKLRLTGEPVPVAEHVGATRATGMFSVSRAGVLAYRTVGNAAAQAFQLTWFDREGKVSGTFGQPSPDQGITLSPDGTKAAGRDAAQAVRGDIWLLDWARGVRTRFTFRQSAGSFPVWSPDGSRITFSSSSETMLDTIYEKSASGAGEEKELYKRAGEIKAPTSWSHDGRFLLFNTVQVPKTGSDLWVISLEGERKATLLLRTEFQEGLGSFSPDGRWVAYISNESGRGEVYVRPFVASGPSLGDGKWQVSKDGAVGSLTNGVPPKWRSDGKELVFIGTGNRVMAVDVNGSGAAFQTGTPHALFTLPADGGTDMTPDGKRFLASVTPGQSQQGAQAPITVILNWQADLKK